jgi:hypothetical protein
MPGKEWSFDGGTQPNWLRRCVMKGLSVIIPAGVTAVLTVLAVFSAVWLAGLVPDGDWASLIKAGIVIFIIGSTIVVIAWSAYFTYIIRQSMQNLKNDLAKR